MKALVNIGRWLGFFIAITLGAVAMAICLIAALFQASAVTILSLTEEDMTNAGL